MLGNSSFKIFTFKILGDNISQKLLKLEISKKLYLSEIGNL